MKRIKFLSALLLLFTAFGISSCDVEPIDSLLLNPGEEPTPDPAAFQVDFGTQTYIATSYAATVGDGMIMITATRASDGGTFSITVPATTTGTYTTTAIIFNPGTSGNVFSNISMSGVTGSVTISSINTTTHTVTGTFNFIGTWSNTADNIQDMAFTNGIFTNIPYIAPGEVQPPLFTVDFDGQTFTGTEYSATVGNSLISVAGLRGTQGEYVGFVLEGAAVGEGTYTEVLMSYSPSEDSDLVYSNISLTEEYNGTVIISEIDEVNHTISGTFNFTGYSDSDPVNKTFTNGVFENIPYTTGVPASDDVFKATVDGTAVDYIDDLIVSTANEFINIQGLGTDHQIRLVIVDTTINGTYSFGDISTGISAFYKDAAGVEYPITGGSLLVTANTGGVITGTFSFDVKNTAGEVIHAVTNGEVSVEY